jgi:ABC-type maltose transport system permease subunit
VITFLNLVIYPLIDSMTKTESSYFCKMITDQEQLFINYWEANRDKQKKIFYQLAWGLPIGLVFALPVLLSVLFHDWYKNMVFISGSQVTFILITVLGIAVFFALFRMKFKWEENEQRYKELKFKQSKKEPTLL